MRRLRNAHKPVTSVARIGLVFLISLIAVPLRFHAVQAGLDPSWAFALNWFHSRGLLHGRDIGFTWGPLAHLAIAMDVGGGLGIAVAAQLIAWGVFVAVLGWLALRKQVALWRLAVFALGTYTGSRLFHIFGYAGFDFFLSWLVLLMLGCSLEARRWYIPYSAAVAIAAVLALMKFSTGIAAVSAVAAFPLVARSMPGVLITAVGLPLAFVAGFLLHNPSFSGLARYLKTGYELSSEHSTILSLPGSLTNLYLALTLLGCYVIVVGLLLWTRNRALPLAIAMAGPLFLEFKHSFIREPGHLEILFLFLPLVAAVLVLFVKESGRSRGALIAVAVLFASLSLYAQTPRGINLAGTNALREIFAWTPLKHRLAGQSAANLAVDILPAELLARVGKSSVSIFPWESSYAAANELNYRPFPVFQSYDAYTPFLDGWNAEFFENRATAPEFVLFDWSAIDQRHPLLDVPQMAGALYRNYALEGVFGTHMLLRKLTTPRFRSVQRKIMEADMRIGEKLLLPKAAGALIVRLHVKWSTAGELKKFFWRSGAIRWIGMYGDGTSVAARVPPAVLAGGVPIDLIPANATSMRELYSGAMPRKMESISIVGAGANDLVSSARYEVWEINDLPVANVPPVNVTMLPGLRGDCKIDVINDIGVLDRNDIVPVPATGGYVTIRGWAGAPLGEVVLLIDGKPHRTEYGHARVDVATIFRNSALSNSGFELTLPAADLRGKAHQIRAIVRSGPDGYQECVHAIRFLVD